MAIQACLVCFTITILVATVKGCSVICPPKPSSPGPLVAPKNGSDIVRKGRAKLFSCCGAGFVNISWSFWGNGSEAWTAVTPRTDKVQICNDGQVLQFMAVETKDDGRYRCTLTNGTADVSAYFRLKVEVCDSMYHPPRVMKAPQNTSARVGDSITFLCEGFFGCGDPMFKNVRFFSKITNIKKGKLEFFHLGHHDNYIYKMYNTTNMDVIGANLTIRRVMIQNFSQIYICDLGTVRRSAVILPLDVTVKITVVEIVLIACVSTAAMIMMLIIAISCWLHFPRILFWCNTKFNTCSRKGEFLYDTAVVCIEQDIPVVRGRLLQMLREQLGYHVYFGPDDLSGGHGETTGQTDLFPKTYCAIMFISKESLEENAFKFICHCATCLVGGPYLILIKRGDIPKSAWSHVPRNLERRLKVILSLTLPEESNGEDVQRFLSSIRSKLPKPQTKTRTTSDRQSLSSFEVTLLSDTDD